MADGYSSDELKTLVRILNEIIAEAKDRRPDLSKDDIVQHAFALTDEGERSVSKLRDAVFGIAQAADIESTSIAIFPKHRAIDGQPLANVIRGLRVA